MPFSDYIPDKLSEHPNVAAFSDVLDSLNNFKTEIISESFRVNNFAVLMNKKWLLKKLEEYGVSGLSLDYPIQIIQQYLLNADTICRTRGSKLGVELYCSLLSFGEVIIDDTDFYADTTLLLMDSTIQGYITDDNSKNTYYLCEDNDILKQNVTLRITIKSKYFNGQYPLEERVIKSYIENTIGNQLGFSPDKEIIFDYQEKDDFYFHKLLNSYFI